MEENNISLNQTEQVVTEAPKKGEGKGLLFLALAIIAVVLITAVSLLIILNLNSTKESKIVTPVDISQTPKSEVPVVIETNPAGGDAQTIKLSEQTPSTDITSIEKDLSDTNFLDLDDGSSDLDLSLY